MSLRPRVSRSPVCGIEVALELPVLRQGRGQSLDESLAARPLTQRQAGVRQQDPAAADVDGQGNEHPVGRHPREKLVQAGLEGCVAPRRLQPDPAPGGRGSQQRRPRPRCAAAPPRRCGPVPPRRGARPARLSPARARRPRTRHRRRGRGRSPDDAVPQRGSSRWRSRGKHLGHGSSVRVPEYGPGPVPGLIGRRPVAIHARAVSRNGSFPTPRRRRSSCWRPARASAGRPAA